jgi:hypothetical protein
MIIIVLLLSVLLSAEKAAPLPELMKPGQIKADKNNIYVVEGATIYIYSLKDFSLRKKFGKKGEGPQEFMLPPPGRVELIIRPDALLVNSLGKLSYFTTGGEFQKEIKISVIMDSWVSPLGNRFAGVCFRQEDNIFYNTINIFDEELKKGEEIFKFKSALQPGKVDFITAARLPLLCTMEDKIYFGGKDGDIYVFDDKGKKLSTIRHEYEKVKLSEARKKMYIDFFKTDPRYKQGWEQFGKQAQFPAYFPVLRDLTVSDGKLYILTYKEKDGKREFYISGTDGKLIKKTMLLLPEMNPLELYPYTINNNKLYQLIENEDSETWELHITKIEE